MKGFHRWYLVVVCCFLLGYTMVMHSSCGSKDKCSIDSDCLVGQYCRMDPTVSAKTCQGSNQANECQPACSTGQSCVSGKCVTLCNPPCSAQEACVSGKCQSVTNDCKPPCTGQDKCVSGTCIPGFQETMGESVTPPTEKSGEEPPVTTDNTSTCQSDNDCKTGMRCEQGRCVNVSGSEKVDETGQEAISPNDGGNTSETTTETTAQDTSVQDTATTETTTNDTNTSCQKDTDCASGLICQNGSCVPATGCGSGCQANQQCVNGRCETEQNNGIGQACSTQNACPSGLTCLNLDPQTSRCFQKCTNSGDCSQNTLRKICLQLTATESYCVQIASIGQTCGLDGKIQAICDNISVCQGGSCVKPVEVKPQEACGSAGRVCPKDHLCLRFSSNDGNSYSYCMSQCTPGSSTCGSNATCEPLGSSIGFCLPAGTATNDALCGAQAGGATFDTSRVCQSGLDCVSLVQPICLKFATGDCATSKLTCPSDRKCQDLNGPQSQKFSICSKVCSQDSDCGKTHMQCLSGTCWPKAPTGNVEYASPCKAFGSTKELCQAGLSCFYLGSSSTSGYCSKPCQKDTDCPAGKDTQGQSIKAVCMVGSGMCGFVCGIGQTCPTGLQCVQNQFCGP